MKKLGLVGGISWVSTIDYYRYLNEGINEKLGGLNFAECIIYSLNFGDIQARQWDHSFDLLSDACENLKKSGAEAIVLCANTAHMMAKELEEKIELPIINIVTATAKEIQKNGYRKVGLLATKFTMEMDFYKEGLLLENIETLIPLNEATRHYIQETLKEELGRGIIKEATRMAYIAIINEMIERGSEAIILGCTEIPLIIKQEDVSVPLFDTTKIHVAAAITFALS